MNCQTCINNLAAEELQYSKRKFAANKLIIITSIIFLLPVAYITWQSFSHPLASPPLARQNSPIASNAIRQYEIVKHGNDKLEICIRASIVADSYLRENDEYNFRIWKTVQHSDCQNSGAF